MAFPEPANLNITRGADFNFTLQILDSLGAAAALTGGQTAFKAEIRKAFKKPKVVAFSITVQNEATGVLSFQLSNEQTLLLDPNKEYEWDFFWTDTTGVVYPVMAGLVRVQPNITHL